MLTVEKVQDLLKAYLTEMLKDVEAGARQKWYAGELPYSIALFLRGNDNDEIFLGRVKLTDRKIVGFNNASDAVLKDLLRPKIKRVLDEAGFPLFR